MEDSGWVPADEDARCATGVMIGSGIGGLGTIYEAAVMVSQGKARRLSPFFIPSALINLASGHVSIKYGFKGPNHSVVTACATGVHAIGDAARLIMLGDADVMVAGGAEGTVNELGMAGFCASRALSTKFNDQPTAASRPWDRDRDGFVMSEGAGIVVLEELEQANLFVVPLDDARQWYRYHHLFADVLRHRLHSGASPDEVRQLHMRAAAWHEQQGLIAEAFQHSSQAADHERCARLVEQMGRQLTARGETGDVGPGDLGRLRVRLTRGRDIAAACGQLAAPARGRDRPTPVR